LYVFAAFCMGLFRAERFGKSADRPRPLGTGSLG
jgi:hypothetical protein